MRKTKIKPTNRKAPTRIRSRPSEVRITPDPRRMDIHPMILMLRPSIGEGGAASLYFRWAQDLVRGVLVGEGIGTAQELHERSCQTFVDMANRDADRGDVVPDGAVESSLEMIALAVQNVVYLEDLP